MEYERTLQRVETYFDNSATEVWARLTSDAPVSRVRATVRAGRNAMRDQLLSRLPEDVSGAHVLDAGCGTGQLAAELGARGAHVTGMDISPALLNIARARLPEHLSGRVTFELGDLRQVSDRFDAIIAMDSLIYYQRDDLTDVLSVLASRAPLVLFTVAPRTPLLWTMWQAGKLFPRADRSPVMTPQTPNSLAKHWSGPGTLTPLDRVSHGFYISHAMEISQ